MREKEYSEWMSTLGLGVLRHANCCKIAFNGGWESRQTEVDELQKSFNDLQQMFIEQARTASCQQARIDELERALKGGGE